MLQMSTKVMQSSAVFYKTSFQIKMNFPKSVKVIFFFFHELFQPHAKSPKTKPGSIWWWYLPAQRGRRERKKNDLMIKETAFVKLMIHAKPLPKKAPSFLQLIELQKSSINNRPIYIVPSLSFVGISQVAIFLLKITFIFFFF